MYVFGVSIFCLLCLPGHSQEIIDKLTEAEEELREQLDGEIREKEYLQECLDETGQILYQLKNNEQRLLEDKDTLLDDLENELQVCIMVWYFQMYSWKKLATLNIFNKSLAKVYAGNIFFH